MELRDAARGFLAAWDRLEEAKSDVHIVAAQDDEGKSRPVTYGDVLAARVVLLQPLMEDVKGKIEALRAAAEVA